MDTRWRRLGVGLAGAGVLVAAGIVGAAAFVGAGIYDVAATQPHLAPVQWLLHTVMRRSVRVRADRIAVPPLDAPRLLRTGVACYRAHCLQCHGAPGIAPEPAALGLMPLPTNLVQPAREWSAAELYWVTRHGVRTTGMPAWEFRMSDESLWATVAFLKRLPALTPAEFRDLGAAGGPADCPVGEEPAAGSIEERGRLLLRQYACITCHRIPGVVGPDVHVGPPLQGMARRAFIAGTLPNTPDNMVRWIVDPDGVSPGTLMPDLRVPEAHARDIALYLDTLQ